jgi:hypothetical protein
MMETSDGWQCKFWRTIATNREVSGILWAKPRYQPGEVVYIQEKYAYLSGNIWYAVDCDPGPANEVCEYSDGSCFDGDWRSPVLMPEKLSRSRARITDVRVERVQKITWEDALKEGIEAQYCCDGRECACQGLPIEDPREDFIALWNSLHPGSWSRNDWVWRCGLEMVEK